MRLRISKLFFSLMVIAGTLSVPAFAINLQPGFDTGPLAASQVTPSCQNWSKNLSCADNNQQAVDDVVDQLSSGGGGSVSIPNAQIPYGNSTGTGLTSRSTFTTDGMNVYVEGSINFGNYTSSLYQVASIYGNYYSGGVSIFDNYSNNVINGSNGSVAIGSNNGGVSLNSDSGDGVSLNAVYSIMNITGGSFLAQGSYGTTNFTIENASYTDAILSVQSNYAGLGQIIVGQPAGDDGSNSAIEVNNNTGGAHNSGSFFSATGNTATYQVFDGGDGTIRIATYGLPTSNPADGTKSLWVDGLGYVHLGT